MIADEQEMKEAVDAIRNLVGDGDLDPQKGLIEVDRSTPDHPVLRLRADRLPEGGGSSDDGDAADAAPFDVALVNNVPTVVNCVFYFGGTLRTLSDYAAPASGTLYLAFTRSDPDQERGEPAVWSYQLTTTPAEPSTGASTVMNVKLYDFAAGKVTMDYRSAFLTVPAPDFDLYYGKYEFKKLQLGSAGADPVEIGKIVASQDATITQKTLVAGQNITLTEANGVITISAAGTSVSAGPGITVSNGVVAANTDGNTISIHSGSGNARTIQLRGAENPGSCLIEEYRTLGERLARTENSDAMSSCYVPVLHNGVIKYIPFAELNIQVAAHSGFDVIRGSDTGGRPCLFVTWDGRSNPYGTYPDIALRTVNIYAADGTVASTVEVPASAAFKIPAVKGGNGITVTPESDGAVQRIDAAVADVTAPTGSGIVATKNPSTGVVSLTLANNDTTTYYTDTGNGLRLCVGATYDTSTHKFTAQYLRFNVQAGRLCANPTSETKEVFEAVQES